jgi:hypothetical protein
MYSKRDALAVAVLLLEAASQTFRTIRLIRTVAFSNSGDKPAKVFFRSPVPGGHENYFDELTAIMEASKGWADADVVADLRARYDIEQITGLR